jgi:hypothetical protein
MRDVDGDNRRAHMNLTEFMKSGYQLSDCAAQLANHEAEIQRAVSDISFVEAGFLL